MTDIEGVRIDIADLGNAVGIKVGRAEAFGPQQQPGFLDNDIDVAAHDLVVDRIELIVAVLVDLRRRGWRGHVIDEFDQIDRREVNDIDADRLEDAGEPIARRHHLGMGGAANRHAA